MVSILDPLVDKAGGIRKTSAWYRNAVSSIADRVSARRLMNQGKLIGRPSIGRLNMFVYDPKYKKTLPYYDTFPLVLPLERLQRYATRGREITSTNSFDVSYNRVKNISLVKGTIKKYLFAHVRSNFLRIDFDEAALAVYLPVAQFKKGSPY